MKDIPTPAEVRAMREKERQQLRDAGVEPISDYRKPEPEKRKIRPTEIHDGFESADAIRRWLPLTLPSTDTLQHYLEITEMRIMDAMTKEMRDLFEQRDVLRAAYRDEYFKEYWDK